LITVAAIEAFLCWSYLEENLRKWIVFFRQTFSFENFKEIFGPFSRLAENCNLSNCENKIVCAIKFLIKVNNNENQSKNLSVLASENHEITQIMSFNCPFIDGPPVIPIDIKCILTNLLICTKKLFYRNGTILVWGSKVENFCFSN
jgi:hypothetical protein